MSVEQERQNVRRVLLVCVGHNDPFNQRGGEGPIVSFCDYVMRIPAYRKYCPDCIYLFSTVNRNDAKRPTQDNGELTKEYLVDEMGKTRNTPWGRQVYHRPLDVLDPTDYGELIPKLQEALTEVQRTHPSAEYIVNVSPGTGQMEAVWISFAQGGILRGTLLQVKSPQEEPDEEKRIRAVKVDPLVEHAAFRICTELFSQFGFMQAAKLLSALSHKTPLPERKTRAQVLSELAEAYYHWDARHYSESITLLKRIEAALQHEPALQSAPFGQLRQEVRRQHQELSKLHQCEEMLRQLSSNPSTKVSISKGFVAAYLVDMHQGSRRRYKVEQYDEVIWRCKTVAELAEEYFNTRWTPGLHRLSHHRATLVHDGIPASPYEANNAIQALDSLLRKIVQGGQGLGEDHPFSPEALQRLAEQIPDWLT